MCSHPGAVASPHLAVHHRWPDCLLSLPVGRLYLRMAQERKPLVQMLPQMPRQGLVGRHLPHRPRQLLQPLVVLLSRFFQRLCRHFSLEVAIAQVDRLGEQSDQLPRIMHGASLGLGLQLAHPAEQVIQALLVRRLAEPIIRREAVVSHFARPVYPYQLLQRIGLAVPVNGVAGRTLGYPGVQPGWVPAYPPARFVRCQAQRSLDFLANLLVGRLQPPRRTQHNLGAGAARHFDAEDVLEDPGYLAVGQAIGLVQHDGGGLGIGAELRRGGAEGIGGLQRMASLDALAALTATADMDVELADDRLARDFGLILAGDKGLVERAAAVRASVREDCLVNLIDGSRVGGQAMAVTAVSRTAFATG